MTLLSSRDGTVKSEVLREGGQVALKGAASLVQGTQRREERFWYGCWYEVCGLACIAD